MGCVPNYIILIINYIIIIIKFLLEQKFAPEKNIPFLAYWVSRFLTFSRKLEYKASEYQESAVFEFLDILRADK